MIAGPIAGPSGEVRMEEYLYKITSAHMRGGNKRLIYIRDRKTLLDRKLLGQISTTAPLVVDAMSPRNAPFAGAGATPLSGVLTQEIKQI